MTFFERLGRKKEKKPVTKISDNYYDTNSYIDLLVDSFYDGMEKAEYIKLYGHTKFADLIYWNIAFVSKGKLYQCI